VHKPHRVVIDNRAWLPGYLAVQWVRHFESMLYDNRRPQHEQEAANLAAQGVSVGDEMITFGNAIWGGTYPTDTTIDGTSFQVEANRVKRLTMEAFAEFRSELELLATSLEPTQLEPVSSLDTLTSRATT